MTFSKAQNYNGRNSQQAYSLFDDDDDDDDGKDEADDDEWFGQRETRWW